MFSNCQVIGIAVSVVRQTLDRLLKETRLSFVLLRGQSRKFAVSTPKLTQHLAGMIDVEKVHERRVVFFNNADFQLLGRTYAIEKPRERSLRPVCHRSVRATCPCCILSQCTPATSVIRSATGALACGAAICTSLWRLANNCTNVCAMTMSPTHAGPITITLFRSECATQGNCYAHRVPGRSRRSEAVR